MEITDEALQAELYACEADIQKVKERMALLTKEQDRRAAIKQVDSIPGLTGDERNAIVQARLLRLSSKQNQAG